MESAITPSQTTTQLHIDACSTHANPTWKTAALAAIMRLAARQQTFTSYDVLQELAKSPDVRTHDLRAVGGVLQEARDLGVIVSGGLVRRNDKHSRGATTLWQSNLRCPSAQATTSAAADSQ
jgi:hypothetical protein